MHKLGIFPELRVRKVSDSESDLQDHSRSFVLVPLDRPSVIFCSSSIVG